MNSLQLEMKGITKSFSEEEVLKKVNFNSYKGEVHALLGVNGAGKSTLIKILSGLYVKDYGEIFIDKEFCNYSNPHEAIEKGIATVYQEPEVISSFNGYENIFLGYENIDKKKGKFFTVIKREKMKKEAEKLLKSFPVNINLNKPVSFYTPLEREVILILRALSKKMKILILDEPTSFLTKNEKNTLFELIRILKKGGVSIIYISHRLEEIEEIADRITILRAGKNVATIDLNKDKKNSKEIVEIMLGKKLQDLYPEKRSYFGDIILSVRNLSIDYKFSDINFDLRKGRILGIFGLLGSGIIELSKALFGIERVSSGDIIKGGKKINLKGPKDAIKNGIFEIPIDRRIEGLIGDESVAFNVSISNLKRISGFIGHIFKNKERDEVVKMVNDLNINPPDINKDVLLLSGGNQQKVVIGKALYSEADIYIFVEPTVGVDIGAKAAIYKKIRELSNEYGVIIISSDCEEIYCVCDELMVMYKGVCKKKDSTDSCSLEEMLLYACSERNGL